MKTTRLTFFILLYTLSFSCNNKPDKGSDNIDYQIVTFETSFGDCSNTDSNCYEIKIVCPELKMGNPGVQTRINASIRDTVLNTLAGFSGLQGNLPSSVEDISKNIFNEFARLKEEFSDFSQQWYIRMEAEVLLANEQLISIMLFTDSYTGGAHGNSWISFLNFSTETGTELTWKDMVTNKKEFLKLSEIKFRKVREIPVGASLGEAGFFFKDDVFVLPQSIGFTEEGMVSVFNSYEAGPYYLGPTEYLIPWNKLEFILKDPYKILAGK